MENIEVRIGTKQSKTLFGYYVGTFSVYENGVFQWSGSTHVARIHADDALDDAAFDRAELLRINRRNPAALAP